MQETLEFFRTGVSPVSPEEMVMIVAIEKAAELSMSEGGVWVEMDCC
jgi:hypothetical protein